ncbi:MAG: helix-turn-helix domain-containing protein [Candidatus Bruticola sp.]
MGEKSRFSANIMARLKRGSHVALGSIEKICSALDCSVDDILEFRPDKQERERHG